MTPAPLTDRQRERLQSLLDFTVAASERAKDARRELGRWCREVYGIDPAAAECAQIAAALCPQGGRADPLGVDAFDRFMRERRHGHGG